MSSRCRPHLVHVYVLDGGDVDPLASHVVHVHVLDGGDAAAGSSTVAPSCLLTPVAASDGKNYLTRGYMVVAK